MRLLLPSSLAFAICGATPVNRLRQAGGGTSPSKTGGSGLYPATYSVDPSLSTHTLYQPASPPENLTMPVLVWGETGCTYNSLVFQTFLTEVASHGIFIVAAGTPNGANNPNGVRDTENPNGTVLVQAVDWVTSSEAKEKYPKVDSSRLAVAGHSCGGTQSYMLWDDARVTGLGIFNSGLFPPQGKTSHPIPAQIKKPIFYFLGGPTDIAYKNGERDYTELPATTPRWKGNLAVGHGGTFFEAKGGRCGVAAVQWLSWLLRGDNSAAKFFTGEGAGTARGDGWTVVSGALDAIKATSPGR